jgi:hypothetical protein
MHLRAKAVTLLTALSMLTGPAHAGLLHTDGADPVEARHVELELNGVYMADSSKNGGDKAKDRSSEGDLQLDAGIVTGLGIIVTLPYTAEAREQINGNFNSKAAGFSDLNVALKYRFIDSDGLKLTLKPAVILPTGNSSEGLSDGRFGYTTSLLATKEFAEGKFTVHSNVGYERHNYRDDAVRQATGHDLFTFSVACEAEVAEKLTLAADIGLATNLNRASDTPPAFALVGIKYEFIKAVEGYAGVKAGITKPEDDVAALLGVVFKF